MRVPLVAWIRVNCCVLSSGRGRGATGTGFETGNPRKLFRSMLIRPTILTRLILVLEAVWGIWLHWVYTTKFGTYVCTSTISYKISQSVQVVLVGCNYTWFTALSFFLRPKAMHARNRLRTVTNNTTNYLHSTVKQQVCLEQTFSNLMAFVNFK